MRRLNLPALLLLAACTTDGGNRQACWEAAPAEDAPLTATQPETLGDRVVRRSVHEPRPPPHAGELGTCPPRADSTGAARSLDDRERAEHKLKPLIEK